MIETMKQIVDTISHNIPALRWIPSYNRQWLKYDLIAGITLAMFAIPDGMAYATLAGLPPEYGLYAGIFAPVGYFLFASSRQAFVGPSSSEALMVGSFLGILAIGSVTQYAALAALTAFLVGIIAIIAWVFRMGFLVNLISGPVLKGFLAGSGIVIIMSQIPKLLGISGVPQDFFGKIAFLIQNIEQTNIYSLALGSAAIIGILAIDRKYKQIPGSLVIVIAAIIVMTGTDLVDKGVKILGPIPQGLPELGIPSLNMVDIATVLPLAIALFILSFVELSTIARTYAQKNRYKIDTNQELLALGASSMLVGIGHGFPVAGSFSKSAVNDRCKAQTPLSGLVAAVIILVVLLLFTSFFQNLPVSVVAGLIIVAVINMVNISGLIHIGHIDRKEFAIAIITFSGVVLYGILAGVIFGTILSLIDILYKITFPHTAVLGRVPGTDIFGDVERDPPKVYTPGVIIFRVDSPMFFANVATVKDQLEEHIDNQIPAVKLVILDLNSSPIVDVTAVDMLVDLSTDLNDRGIQLRLANTTGQVRDLINKSGVVDRFGHLDAMDPVTVILDEWKGEEK